MKVRTPWIVVVAGIVVGRCVRAALCHARSCPGAVEGQQPPAVPSAAPTVQAGGHASSARLHPDRPEVARGRCARLSAVQRGLEQASHRSRRPRRRVDALSVGAGARQYRRDVDVQGRCGLYDGRREVSHGGLPQAGRRARQHSRHALRRRPAVVLDLVGGGKKHGGAEFSSGAIKYTIVDKASPIMKGMSDFEIADEAFFKITWAHRRRSTSSPPHRCRHPVKSCRRCGPTNGPSSAAAVPRLRVDAGPHLHEFQESADRGDAASRDRVGRALPGRITRERCRQPARRRPWQRPAGRHGCARPTRWAR